MWSSKRHLQKAISDWNSNHYGWELHNNSLLDTVLSVVVYSIVRRQLWSKAVSSCTEKWTVLDDKLIDCFLQYGRLLELRQEAVQLVFEHGL